jgi:flagellar hook-associated protein 2
MINGVSIAFDVSSDSLKNVIDRINVSSAGVTASYDPVNDRLSLTNTVEGDLGIGLEDVSGNFLSATGLTGGSLSRGKNLEYTINGGSSLVSNSNTITESSSGITGLSVSALKVGSVTVGVKSDTDAVKDAIDQFLDGYNKVQALIEKETSSTTDDKGKVTAGTLAGQPDANEIAGKLRAMAFGAVAGLSGTIERLAGLGIDTNGDNNNLSLSDAGLLDDALLNNMTSVAEMFTNESNGFAVQLETYLEKLAGDDGELDTRIENLANRSTSIDDNIAQMERRVQANREQMISRFVVMETAQANINQQLAQLQQNLAGIGA